MTKVKTDYTNYTDEAIGPVGLAAYQGLSANAATFPAPVPDLVTFKSHLDAYNLAMANVLADPGHANTLTKNNTRKVLEKDLASLGTYVNLVAQGDGTLTALSGLPSYDTATPSPAALRSAPVGLRLKQGTASGSIEVRFKQQVADDNADVQTCTGDPNVDANWTHAKTFTGGVGVLEGFTPGSVVWVRVRSIGPGGTLSPWSAAENMRVI